MRISRLSAFCLGILIAGCSTPQSTTVPMPSQPQSARRPHAAGFVTLKSFNGNDGENPYAGLTLVNQRLYGTTYSGGTEGLGTVFVLNPVTGVESVLHSFDGSDGANPNAGVVAIGGNLYGATYGGGDSNKGTVFVVDIVTGKEQVLYSFRGEDGAKPYGGLTVSNGMLYGTTSVGGANNLGTVFSFDTFVGRAKAVTRERVLFSFDGSKGSKPYGQLVVVNGVLYGTTYSGGEKGLGTIFWVTLPPLAPAQRTVLSFSGPDGSNPYAGLTSSNGLLYGTTVRGGDRDDGIVFELNPLTGTRRTLYTFGGKPDGAAPYAALTSSNGQLYGTTKIGGAKDLGTVFEVNPASGAGIVVYSFTGEDGANPDASVTVSTDGLLYGTTYKGGKNDNGTAFVLSPAR
jgi:uncharacterized repeat protein (TIGR03803 family)